MARGRAARSRFTWHRTRGNAKGPRAPARGPLSRNAGGQCRRESGRLEHLLELLRRRRLVDFLDGRELAHQTVERSLIDLALAVGLVRLVGVAVQVAHDLG